MDLLICSISSVTDFRLRSAFFLKSFGALPWRWSDRTFFIKNRASRSSELLARIARRQHCGADVDRRISKHTIWPHLGAWASTRDLRRVMVNYDITRIHTLRTNSSLLPFWCHWLPEIDYQLRKTICVLVYPWAAAVLPGTSSHCFLVLGLSNHI
jgi:hypothetical protein